MGYPSEGKESFFRNRYNFFFVFFFLFLTVFFFLKSMQHVKKFFKEYHSGKYMIYNLCSERKYDHQHFLGFVREFGFDDHNAPPFMMIIDFCEDVAKFLEKDFERIGNIFFVFLFFLFF